MRRGNDDRRSDTSDNIIDWPWVVVWSVCVDAAVRYEKRVGSSLGLGRLRGTGVEKPVARGRGPRASPCHVLERRVWGDGVFGLCDERTSPKSRL
jgi:hypothetical protein